MQIDNFCLIIGTQKGGTSSLFSYLSQHPQIAVSNIKETNFFSEAPQWEKGLDYYEGLWDWDEKRHAIALEASPNYTNSLEEAMTVAERTHALNTEQQTAFKFIYVLRNPLQKIESMRKQGVYQGWYEKYLEKETPESVPMEVIETVRYADVVDVFVEKFSAEKMLLLRTEEISPKGEPAVAMRKICNFLEVDPAFEFALEKIHNARNSYREDTLWHYLRSQQYFDPLKRLVPDTLKNKARSALSKPLKPNEKVVSSLLPAQKEFIVNALKEERNRLSGTYGLDVSAWSRAT
ncbi:MAG: sulfotransferase domain-containing protein [Cyanobacteria bacterium J06634_5]